LIAAGDLVDFTQEAVWPRFTMNATAITFPNTVAYKYYQVMFPTVRDAGSANSMQIGEVELLGVPAPVGHWTFDDGDGTVALDSSGNGYDGTVDLATWETGRLGSALGFDGTAHVDVPAEAWSTVVTQATVAFWAYGDPAAQPQSNFIFGAFSDPADNNARKMSAHVPWGNGNVYFDTGGPGYDRISKAGDPADFAGTWTHWTFVKNADTGDQQIYINGELWHSGTGMTQTMDGVTKFTIGTKPSLAEGWFTGMIDEVKLYNTALSQEEILWLAGRTEPVVKPF
jgi:hypothetical protein